MNKWFNKLRVCLENPDSDTELFLYSEWRHISRWKRFWCRLKNHPYESWDNTFGNRCGNCGDKFKI